VQFVTQVIGDAGCRRCRQRLSILGLASLICAALLGGSTAAAAPGQAAIVRPDPLNATVPVGGQVVVNIFVQDVQNLYGADIRLSFDPAILEVQDMNPAVSGVQIQPLSTFLKPDFVARNGACNLVDPACPIPGIVRYAATQVNPSLPVSGSGALAAVTFKRLTPGVTGLKIVAHELSDRYGVTIPSGVQSGLIGLPATQVLYFPLVAYSDSGVVK
jgi:hypothetical protein